jgi:predicted short-subunit dehydrogenase-like oxidoreductase (DUF2520 family)
VFERVNVIGRGRVGAAIAARLAERGVNLGATGAELVLLCVPDSAIAQVASDIEPGPWVAHVSGATSLTALTPHNLRFSVHPLQTSRSLGRRAARWRVGGGDGGKTARPRSRDSGSPNVSDYEPSRFLTSPKASITRALPSRRTNLVTLYRSAARLLTLAGAPPEALVPLMRRTIENGFELTGPMARGDWSTVDAHLEAIHAAAPDLDVMYRALAEVTGR